MRSKGRTRFQVRGYYGDEQLVSRPGQWQQRRGADAKPGKRDRARRKFAVKKIQRAARRYIQKKMSRQVMESKFGKSGAANDVGAVVASFL